MSISNYLHFFVGEKTTEKAEAKARRKFLPFHRGGRSYALFVMWRSLAMEKKWDKC